MITLAAGDNTWDAFARNQCAYLGLRPDDGNYQAAFAYARDHHARAALIAKVMGCEASVVRRLEGR